MADAHKDHGSSETMGVSWLLGLPSALSYFGGRGGMADTADFDNSRLDINMQVKNVYTNKDGRQRAYCIDENGKPKVVSYPRILMEEKLGRPLEPHEDVHHIDNDKTNNDPNNLALIHHGEHQKLHAERKYFDKEAICDVCGAKFIWTAKRQQRYYMDLRRNRNRIISCSRKCSSLHGRLEQLRRNS